MCFSEECQCINCRSWIFVDLHSGHRFVFCVCRCWFFFRNQFFFTSLHMCYKCGDLCNVFRISLWTSLALFQGSVPSDALNAFWAYLFKKGSSSVLHKFHWSCFRLYRPRSRSKIHYSQGKHQTSHFIRVSCQSTHAWCEFLMFKSACMDINDKCHV